MERIALYAGSFDPLTNGHLDIIRQGLTIADRVFVAIGIHPGKKPIFSFEERAEMIVGAVQHALPKDSDRVSVISFDGLVVDAAHEHRACMMIRGLRNNTDFDYEMQMAGMNASMAGEIQTVFLPASPGSAHITATLVRQISAMGGDISSFVPNNVAEALAKRQR